MNTPVTVITLDTSKKGTLRKYETDLSPGRFQVVGSFKELGFLPNSSPIAVSPNFQWVISSKNNAGNDGVLVFASNAMTGHTRPMGKLSAEMKPVSWSPDGELVAFQNRSSETREILVGHPRTATFQPIRLPGNPKILYIFWRRFSATGKPSLLVASEARDFRSRLVARHDVLQFTGEATHPKISRSRPAPNSPDPLVAAVGETAVLTIKKWVESRRTYAYDQGESQLVVSSRGDRAFAVVDEFHKSSPEWAAPDRARVLVGIDKRVYSRTILRLSDGKFLQWTADGRQLFLLSDEVALWVNPLTAEVVTQKVPGGLGKVLQIWPRRSTG